LRNELEAKNRLAALGEMSGGLAHQLRNSIGSIVGFCNLLKKQLAKDQLESGYFEELFSEVKETESLVKKFLGFARPLEYQPEETDLVGLVKDTVTAYNQIGSKSEFEINHSIKFTGQEKSILHQADSLLLKQAINNLIDNAISACPDKNGVIEVAVEQNESSIVILVSDNGRGIPEEDLDKIFTPFFSTKPSGTGLGLPLAGKIIDLHGGHISIESTVGIGTTFRIHFPIKARAEIPESVR
jgi:signal transduction histidine kinase